MPARAEQKALSDKLRSEGATWSQIVAEFHIRWGLNARQTIRIARGMSQQDVANEWCRLWPDDPKTFKNISTWERWPEAGHMPSLVVLDRLAQIYHCAVADLVSDFTDHGEADEPPELVAARSKVRGDGLRAELWHTPAHADGLASVLDDLEALAMTAQGSAREDALRLLGKAQQSLGEAAFDQLRFVAALGHFQQMHEIGIEITDPDLTTLALVHQGDVARRRKRYSSAAHLLESCARQADQASSAGKARRCQTLARLQAEVGDRRAFLSAISEAEHWAQTTGDDRQMVITVNPHEMRHERAHGLTLLGRPAEALAIYAETTLQQASGRAKTNLT